MPFVCVQVLGITNYSHWPEAPAVRRCAQRDPILQRKLTRAAEKRLRGFLHVGLMERLDDSIASMAVSSVLKDRLGYSSLSTLSRSPGLW